MTHIDDDSTSACAPKQPEHDHPTMEQLAAQISRSRSAEKARKQEQVRLQSQVNKVVAAALFCTEGSFPRHFQEWTGAESWVHWVGRVDLRSYARAWVTQGMLPIVEAIREFDPAVQARANATVRAVDPTFGTPEIRERMVFVRSLFLRLLDAADAAAAAEAAAATLGDMLAADHDRFRWYHWYFESLADSVRTTGTTLASGPDAAPYPVADVGAPQAPKPSARDSASEWARARNSEIRRGWKAICDAINVIHARGQEKRLTRLNAQTNGPILWVGRVPEVDAGEVRAWLQDIQGRSGAAGRAREQSRAAREELQERGGRRGVELGIHQEQRPNARGKARPA